MRLALKLQKVHCVLEFNLSQWLKPYIKLNAQKRIRVEINGNTNGKGLYKLLNNAIYGKAMENLRNRVDVRLLNNEKDYLKRIPKPSYMPHKIFDNYFVEIRLTKVELKLNKPAYIGICIFELSKVLMYEFHYD